MTHDMKNFSFRKLRLFDIVAFVGVVAAAGIFVYFFFRSNSYVSVTVRVGDDNIVYLGPGVKPWIGMLFHTGMTERDGLGNVAARVTDVWTYKKTKTTEIVYLTADILATLNRASGQYNYRGKPVAVGSTLRMYLDGVAVDGLITDVKGVKDPRERKTIIVKAQLRDETPVYPQTGGVHQEIADAIRAGQKQTDNKGNTVVEIMDKQVSDAIQVITTAGGNTVVTTNPLRKDVSLTLELHVTKLNGRYYIFDDIPVLIGSTIPVSARYYFIEPTITELVSEK